MPSCQHVDSIPISNPWKALPLSPPFVLCEDRESLRACAHFPDDTALHFELLPEPVVGHPNAPVFLLGLNPGFSPLDAAAHANVRFARRLRANLSHEPHPKPFYLLDPALSAPGRGWWERVLKKLVVATARERVMANVSCVEFFPYTRASRRSHSSSSFAVIRIRSGAPRDAPMRCRHHHAKSASLAPGDSGTRGLFQTTPAQHRSECLGDAAQLPRGIPRDRLTP